MKTRVPWLLPILRPEQVVQATWDAVEKDRSRVHLPPIVGGLPLLRGLPVRAFDRVAGLLGVNRTMDEFTGRPRGAVPPSDAASRQAPESFDPFGPGPGTRRSQPLPRRR